MNQDVGSSRRLLVVTAVATVALTVVLLLVFSTVGHGAGGGEPSTSEAAMFDVLPGSILLFRHALTDVSQADADPQARGTCDQQRNLSADGVAQAQRIGRGLAKLPLGAVYASPFCRTKDTAATFGVGDVQVSESLISTTSGLDTAAQVDIVDRGRALIVRELGGDDVVVMVTHTQNIEALTGITVEEGEAVVLVPPEDVGAEVPADTADAIGAIGVVGVIPPDAWQP